MSLLFPLGAAATGIAGLAHDKYIFARLKVNYRQYTVFLFYFLFIFAFIISLFLGKISPGAFSLINITALVGVVVLAAGWNLLWYQGMAKEKLIEVELISILGPLVTILIVSIFLPAERNVHHIIAAVVAAIALIWSHFKKHHLYFDQYQKGLVGAVALMALEVVLVKRLLEFYSPALLYTIRTFLLAVVLTFLVKPQMMRSFKVLGHTALAGLVWVFHMILAYYGFQFLGVVLTILILIVVPIIVYFISVIFFHEKLTYKYVIATVIILAAIIYATVLT